MKTLVGVVSANPQIPSGSTTLVIDGVTLAGFGFLVAVGLGGLRFVLNRAIAQIDRRFVEIGERLEKIEEVESAIHQFKTEVAKEYVTRGEWIAASARVESKLDGMYRRLDQIVDLILNKG